MIGFFVYVIWEVFILSPMQGNLIGHVTYKFAFTYLDPTSVEVGLNPAHSKMSITLRTSLIQTFTLAMDVNTKALLSHVNIPAFCYISDCQKMEAEFVYCYMQAMDSEKDPRHLLLAFQCVTIIAQNFPLGE